MRELTLERDKLATEVQRLRTEHSLHKQAEQEHDLLKERMRSYENHSLERAEKAIRERDERIGDLSTQLERALETLEIERERQRQRRQIIFPGAATKTTQPVGRSFCCGRCRTATGTKKSQGGCQDFQEAFGSFSSRSCEARNCSDCSMREPRKPAEEHGFGRRALKSNFCHEQSATKTLLYHTFAKHIETYIN